MRGSVANPESTTPSLFSLSQETHTSILVADAVNCICQVTVVVITLRSPVIDWTINLIIGAIFQAAYAVEYPLIFVLAVNRFVAVIFPYKMEILFSRKTSAVIMIACSIFGAFNCALCLSGKIQSLWDPMIPAFYFTNQTTFTAVFMRSMDLYLSEFIQISSLVTYIIIITHLVRNTDQK
ncbi:hypothetical protein RB195_016840 [Necator americanus]|uniref:7TM GPCR serpentine receptor class x (Srx) domain-containing protein n=1 Tax=Necator americanus TaxID=51031 RepID=A0ABR1C4W8_NECAM